MKPAAGVVRPGPTLPVRSPARAEQSSKPAETARLRRAAREFEAIFVEHMLKTARQSFPHGGLFPSGAGQDLYRGLVDEQLARSVSRGGGLGLSDLLVRSVLRAEPQKASSSAPAAPIRPGEIAPSVGGPQ
jgi:flagellar protein FlgJ